MMLMMSLTDCAYYCFQASLYKLPKILAMSSASLLWHLRLLCSSLPLLHSDESVENISSSLCGVMDPAPYYPYFCLHSSSISLMLHLYMVFYPLACLAGPLLPLPVTAAGVVRLRGELCGEVILQQEDRMLLRQVSRRVGSFLDSTMDFFRAINFFIPLTAILQSGLQQTSIDIEKVRRFMPTPKPIKVEKLLSTSITSRPQCEPQWVSDSQLNYMSHYDFVSYDLDEDRVELVPKPQPHHVLAARYSPLIGHRNVRVIYLSRDPEEGFSFVALPSFNFAQDSSTKKVQAGAKTPLHISSFEYSSDGQFVVFLVLYTDLSVGLCYMSLAKEATIEYGLFQPGEKFPSASEMSSMNFQEQLNSYNYGDNAEIIRFNNSLLRLTKQPNKIILIYDTTVYYIQLCPGDRLFRIIYTLPLPEVSLPAFNPSADSAVLTLDRTYILYKSGCVLHLCSVTQSRISYDSHFDIKSHLIDDEITTLAASSNSGNFLITVPDKCVLHQFRVNPFDASICYVNEVDLEKNHGESVSKLVLSDTARNVAIFTLSKQRGKYQDVHDVLSFSIFKIELFTELGIQESSLYFKQIKYQNRTKRVNRLVMPKIYENIYALTGSQIHTLEAYRMSGVLFFDIHPCGFYVAVTFSFNIKIYSLEHNSMTLLFTTSMQNLKKVLYSPDGSAIVIFSSRKLKVLNAYSFELVDEIHDKNVSITDVCFSPKRNSLFILYQNGIVIERSLYQFQKSKSYRVFGQGHKKIITLKIDERNQMLLLILEDGSLIAKSINMNNSYESWFIYSDEQKITEVFVDARNCLTFIGTRSGLVRIHETLSEKLDIENYTEVHATEGEVTALACSHLENNLYIGSCRGDIMMLRFYPNIDNTAMSRSSKLINNIAPKVAAYFSFDFELISAAKQHSNSEQNNLEDKLENLIDKIQTHTTHCRQSIIARYMQEESDFINADNIDKHELYRENEGKSKKIKTELHLLAEKFTKTRKQMNEEYETRMKQIYAEQQGYQTQVDALMRQCSQQKQQLLKKHKQEEKQLQLYYTEQMQKNQHFWTAQNLAVEFIDLEDEYKLTDLDINTTLNVTLAQQLQMLKLRNAELNKKNGYLQTAKTNMQSRRIQEQTLETRIQQQIDALQLIYNKQSKKIGGLSQQLKSTEDLIHDIQGRVKNTPNNVISSDKADNDLCSYKIWMKDKSQAELEQLEKYLQHLDGNFEKKSFEMVEIVGQVKRSNQLIASQEQKLQQLKQKLKELRLATLTIQNNNISIQKNTDPSLLKKRDKDASYNYNYSKIRKITGMEKVQDRNMYAHNKQQKIFTRKIKNLNSNNAELLNEYENLKTENKYLKDYRESRLQEIERIKQNKQMQKNDDLLLGLQSERTSLHRPEPSHFIKYIQLKSSRSRRNLHSTALTTATNTPHSPRMSHLLSSANSPRMSHLLSSANSPRMSHLLLSATTTPNSPRVSHLVSPNKSRLF